jgi:hypothetical protein
MKIFLALIFLIAHLSAEDSYTCGELVYPAKKNIDSEQGTFEVWFKFVDTGESVFSIGASSNRPILVFIQVENERDMKSKEQDVFMRFAEFTDGSRHSVGAGFYNDNARLGIDIKQLSLKDDWNYAAITWTKVNSKTYKLMTYVNGVEFRTSEQEYDVKDIDKDAVIKIGCASSYLGKKEQDSGSIGSIDSFRISNKVRTAAEILESYEKGFKEDKETLLFEDFSTLEQAKKYNLASVLKSPQSESGNTDNKNKMKRGTFYGPWKPIEGRNGTKAVELFHKK